ncbi:unnamed protein product [Prunus armeniaca]|uniref:Uncharacterized protein n=1 Tax=Prunus armeniaca TaxID=36596 RepID=A0A6J5VFJ2_PRUAR|nr:unnamed protein product [Prunus armeniaca]
MSDTPSSPVDMICRSMKRFFHIKVFMLVQQRKACCSSPMLVQHSGEFPACDLSRSRGFALKLNESGEFQGSKRTRLDLPLKGTGHNYKSCFCREWLQIQKKSQTFRNSQEVVPKTGDDNRCFQHDPAKPYRT